jgi:heptosyltransferase-2
VGALGDVLRTTCILPGLWEKYRQPKITWVTTPPAVPLLIGNRYLERVPTLKQAQDSCDKRREDPYDLVVSLDEDPEACTLSSALVTWGRFGSYMDGGAIRYTSPSAPWFQLRLPGQQNRETRASLLYSMLKLPGKASPPMLPLTPKEIVAARTRLRGDGIHIGLNTGAGGRRQLKKLSELKVTQLISELNLVPGVRLWLLGGPEEHDRNKRIAHAIAVGEVPTNLELRDFAATIANLGLLVTSDSLALQMALALGIPTVVFFGPTNADAVDLFGIGKKVLPDEGFRCFDAPRCLHTPSCETFQSVSPIVAVVRDVVESITRRRTA